MPPYSILMFCFSGALLLYALSILSEKNGYKMIARHWASNPKDKKAYARQFAKLMVLVAMAPAVSGIVAMTGNDEENILPAMIALVVAFILFIWIGIRVFMRNL